MAAAVQVIEQSAERKHQRGLGPRIKRREVATEETPMKHGSELCLLIRGHTSVFNPCFIRGKKITLSAA
jgi:hypothetical protein